MPRIRIKNFGPVREGNLTDSGWITISKVTVFIGSQGSGKSTVAKLISTFSWIEKSLVRGDYDIKWFQRKNRLKNTFLRYHRLENYFRSGSSGQTEIEYEGDAYIIKFLNGQLQIDGTPPQAYPLPQIMYVPAERNFLAYVKKATELKLSSPSLIEFLTEYDNALHALKKPEILPINNTDIEFDKLNDTVNLRGDGYKLKLTDASSGFQSLVPLFLVSQYLAISVRRQSEGTKEQMSSDEMLRFKRGVEEIWKNNNLTDDQKRITLSVLSSKFNKTAFINIVEEPEQNLFPVSQQKLLFSLLGFNNMNEGNKLIITTHSPYLINYLTLAVKAGLLENELINDESLRTLHSIVPENAAILAEQLSIYELNENGTLQPLPTYRGLPSDENELNEQLAEANDLFAQLLNLS